MTTVRFPKLKEMLLPALESRRSQQWVAERCGVSQPAVNNWVWGYSRPRRANLVFLAHLFQKELDPRELAEAVGYEPDEIVWLYETHFLGERPFLDLMDVANEDVDLIHQLWFRGDPNLAIVQAIKTGRKLEQELKRFPSPKHRNELLRVLSKVLLEQATAYYVRYSPSQAYEVIRPLVKKQDSIAEELDDDEETVGRAFITHATVHYGQKNWVDSQQYFVDASEMVQDLFWKAGVIRGVAVCSASLRDQRGIDRAQTQIKQLLNEEPLSPSIGCVLMEGLARTQAKLGQSQAFQTLEEGWKFYAEAEARGEKAFYRQLQLMRSEIEAILHLERENKRRIEQMGKEAIRLARQNNCLKYAEDIEKLLQEVLD